jgi:hypothetical protein
MSDDNVIHLADRVVTLRFQITVTDDPNVCDDPAAGRLVLSSKEYANLQANAERAGMSLASYLKRLVLLPEE